MHSKCDGRRLLKQNKTAMDKIFGAKRERRRALARLPIEEKIKILIQLQRIAVPILLARGIRRKSWNIE